MSDLVLYNGKRVVLVDLNGKPFPYDRSYVADSKEGCNDPDVVECRWECDNGHKGWALFYRWQIKEYIDPKKK
jgi:hypothetical protein